ncbi:hypothetical protein ACFPM0_23175 [Pseudonocardia sulfidoxydans]|uniref:hypothetical protein n=1 Tax=Pseudonocardia sulfidoxydans TaxID=54011 RepID=UPI003612282E
MAHTGIGRSTGPGDDTGVGRSAGRRTPSVRGARAAACAARTEGVRHVPASARQTPRIRRQGAAERGADRSSAPPRHAQRVSGEPTTAPTSSSK